MPFSLVVKNLQCPVCTTPNFKGMPNKSNVTAFIVHTLNCYKHKFKGFLFRIVVFSCLIEFKAYRPFLANLIPCYQNEISTIQRDIRYTFITDHNNFSFGDIYLNILYQTFILTKYQNTIAILQMSRAMRKYILCHMRTTKTQISLRIRAV